MDLSWEDEFLRNISATVDAHQWAVLFVGGACSVPGCDGDHPSDLDEADLPPYGYTVGLPLRFGHPELVMVGLPNDRTAHVLNAVCEQVAAGAWLEPGDRVDAAGLRLKVGACAVSRVRAGLIAVSFEYHVSVEHLTMPNPLQIMWPDPQGRYPDDRAAGRRARLAQPSLARPRTMDRRRAHRPRLGHAYTRF